MKTFSVLTVSKRTGWERIAVESVLNQTERPKEWIVVTENKLNPAFKGFTNATIIEAPKKIRASNLNASLNAGLRLIDTDYVIFYQDFIELAPDCFEKLLTLADEDTFVTTCTPNYDGSDDHRYTGAGKVRPCPPDQWEANVAIASMGMLRELGGFEEELDNGWAWDNVHLALRAEMLGAKFLIDESNRPKLLPHELTSKLELELNHDRCVNDIIAIRQGKKPINLNYL